MDPKEIRKQELARVTRQLSTSIRNQARDKWTEVRMAERNERGRHVWRFQTGPGDGDRFLHIDQRSLAQGRDAAARLLGQLETEQWLDRLNQGSDTTLLLSRDGQLVPFPRP